MPIYHSKLFQEPHIVFVEDPNVVYIIAQKRGAFDSHTEGIAGKFLRIISDSLEHMRMHHTGTKYF